MASKGHGKSVFGLGFLAGLMITLFMRSEEGRRLLERFQERANDFGEDLGMQFRESIGPLAEDIDDISTQGQRIVGEVASAVKEEAGKSAKTATGMWSSWQESFRKGMARARQYEEGEE